MSVIAVCGSQGVNSLSGSIFIYNFGFLSEKGPYVMDQNDPLHRQKGSKDGIVPVFASHILFNERDALDKEIRQVEYHPKVCFIL